MTPPAGRRSEGDLAGWLAEQGLADAGGASRIADVTIVRALLIAAASEGRAMSYSGLLGALGYRFTRPRMRALCRTLDAIDAAGTVVGEPELAVLVVRESDGLPGQGWWLNAAKRLSYAGSWTGPDGAALVERRQRAAFAYWTAKARPC